MKSHRRFGPPHLRDQRLQRLGARPAGPDTTFSGNLSGKFLVAQPRSQTVVSDGSWPSTSSRQGRRRPAAPRPRAAPPARCRGSSSSGTRHAAGRRAGRRPAPAPGRPATPGCRRPVRPARAAARARPGTAPGSSRARRPGRRRPAAQSAGCGSHGRRRTVGGEAEGRTGGGPGQRHPAAVAALVGAAGLDPDRILQRLGRNVLGLGQAELLALVDVGAAGQREHQQRRGPGPPASELEVGRMVLEVHQPPRHRLERLLLAGVARHRTADVVVAEHPGRRRADRGVRGDGGVDHRGAAGRAATAPSGSRS